MKLCVRYLLLIKVAIYWRSVSPQIFPTLHCDREDGVEDDVDRMECPGSPYNEERYYPSICFCNVFYQCDNGAPHKHFCSPGLWYPLKINNGSAHCDRPSNVNRENCNISLKPIIRLNTTTTNQPTDATTTKIPLNTTTTNQPTDPPITRIPLNTTTTNHPTDPLITTTNHHVTTTYQPYPSTTNEPSSTTSTEKPTTSYPLVTATTHQPVPSVTTTSDPANFTTPFAPIIETPCQQECPKSSEDAIFCLSKYCINHSNESCCYPMDSRQSLVIGYTTAVISAVGSFGTIFTIGSVIYSFFINTSSESVLMPGGPLVMYIFLLQLCVVDSIYCISVLMIKTSYERISMKPWGNELSCVISAFLLNVFQYWERMALVMLAVQKAVAVFRPRFGQPPRLHLKACVILMATSGILVIITMIPTLIRSIPSMNEDMNEDTTELLYHLSFGTFGYHPKKGSCDIINETGSLHACDTLIPMGLMAAAYMSLWWSVTGNKSDLYIKSKNEDNRRLLKARDAAVERSIAFVILAAFLSYLVCALPLTIAYLWPQETAIFSEDSTLSFGILLLLHDFQFSINFIVYAIIPSPLREAQIRFFKQIVDKTKESFKKGVSDDHTGPYLRFPSREIILLDPFEEIRL